MLFILDGLTVGFWNPPLNLEDKALYPTFAHSHLSHLVPSAATLPATAPACLPRAQSLLCGPGVWTQLGVEPGSADRQSFI